MTNEKEEIIGKVRVTEYGTRIVNTIRVYKETRKKEKTTIERNKSVVGDSIEVMMERLREGEGEESILDRDLVYNDNESSTVNPITNIRADKNELMLEEKIGEYNHKHRKMKVVKDEEGEGEEQKETGTHSSEE